MVTLQRVLIVAMPALIVFLMNLPALADPLPGRDIVKFGLLPQDGTAVIPGTTTPWPYFGHDEESSAYLVPGTPTAPPVYITRPEVGQFMADDFQDQKDTPVVHVQWWGSYLGNVYNHQPTGDPNQPLAGRVNKFLIVWETDVPVGDNNPFSHPGTVIQSEVVDRGALSPLSGTFTETLYKPGPVGAVPFDDIFLYNAELECPFPQIKDTIYWVKIVALFENPFNPETNPLIWGWHNRDYTKPAIGMPTLGPAAEQQGTVTDENGTVPFFHYLDDAVSGVMRVATTLDPCINQIEQTGYQPENYVPPFDGPSIIIQRSKDLAFVLYTPEPSALALAVVGLAGVAGYALRQRRRA